jgi:competence protein ComEC
MTAAAVLAVHVGRPARATRTLALAATVLLVVDPFLVHSVGFLLSCGASLGIACLGPGLARWLRGPAWLRETLATTAAAQLGVAPVLLPVFGSMPVIALVANVVAVPVAGPLTTWGLAGGTLSGLAGRWVPGLAHVVQLPTRWMAGAVLGVADAGSRVPLAVDGRAAIGLGLAAAALGGFVRARRRLRRHALVVPPRWPRARPQRADAGDGDPEPDPGLVL